MRYPCLFERFFKHNLTSICSCLKQFVEMDANTEPVSGQMNAHATQDGRGRHVQKVTTATTKILSKMLGQYHVLLLNMAFRYCLFTIISYIFQAFISNYVQNSSDIRYHSQLVISILVGIVRAIEYEMFNFGNYLPGVQSNQEFYWANYVHHFTLQRRIHYTQQYSYIGIHISVFPYET